MISRLGQMLDRSNETINTIEATKRAFKVKLVNFQDTFAYFIWNNPLMVAANDTFTNSILKVIGIQNVFQEKHSRYPDISELDLQVANPNLVLLSSEPYPFREKHILHFQKLLPNSKVVLVDGEYFSWFGSKMVNAPAYFNSLKLTLNC